MDDLANDLSKSWNSFWNFRASWRFSSQLVIRIAKFLSKVIVIPTGSHDIRTAIAALPAALIFLQRGDSFIVICVIHGEIFRGMSVRNHWPAKTSAGLKYPSNGQKKSLTVYRTTGEEKSHDQSIKAKQTRICNKVFSVSLFLFVYDWCGSLVSKSKEMWCGIPARRTTKRIDREWKRTKMSIDSLGLGISSSSTFLSIFGIEEEEEEIG